MHSSSSNVVRGVRNLLAGIFLVAAVLGPVFTFFASRHLEFLHKLHTEGIETQAEILGGTQTASKGRSNQITYKGDVSYSLNLRWKLKSGATAYGQAGPSGQYARGLISYGPVSVPNQLYEPQLTAESVPIKYLEADPSQFILHLDPQNSPEGQAVAVEIGGIVSAVGLGGVLLVYLLGFYRRGTGPKQPSSEPRGL